MLKLALIRQRAGVARAGSILRDNHYGWFERVTPGYYSLSARGRRDLARWAEALESEAPTS